MIRWTAESTSSAGEGGNGESLAVHSSGLRADGTFILYPLLRNVWISFTEFNVIKNEVVRFVGVQNYVDAMKDRHYLTAFRNTLLYTLVTVPGQMFLGLVLASLINSVRRGQTAFKVICYLPVITSWVVVSLVFRYLFMSGSGGLVNYFLMKLHIISKPVAWLQESGRPISCSGFSASGRAWAGSWSSISRRCRACRRPFTRPRRLTAPGRPPLFLHDAAHGAQHYELSSDRTYDRRVRRLHPRYDDHRGRASAARTN